MSILLPLLSIRSPTRGGSSASASSGGSSRGGFRSGSSYHDDDDDGSRLPVWAAVVIAVLVLLFCLFLFGVFRYFRQERARVASAGGVGSTRWGWVLRKALFFATGIALCIWVYRKIARRNKSTEPAPDMTYNKLDLERQSVVSAGSTLAHDHNNTAWTAQPPVGDSYYGQTQGVERK
jgi:hypothetical protein